MDYKAIARAITDPENQPHQWSQEELAKFFVTAADEIERLREALQKYGFHRKECRYLNGYLVCDCGFSATLQQKESE